MEVVKEIENVPTTADKPNSDVVIVDCGELEGEGEEGDASPAPAPAPACGGPDDKCCEPSAAAAAEEEKPETD